MACTSSSSSPSGDDSGAPPPPPFVVDRDASIGVRASAVLSTSCAGGPEASCHGLGAGGMHLPDEPPNLVNVPSTERPDMVRVKPYAPEASYLYLKVIGDAGIDGSRMPPDAPPLDPVSSETLRSWIEAGAP